MPQSPDFTLYGMSSPNVLKVAIMLEELRLGYETRHVAVFRGEQFLPEFLKLNPNSKVPVLVDNRAGADKPVIIFESGAILIYLAEQFGKFLPSQEPERTTTMQWLMIQLCNVGPLLGQLNHFTLAAREGNDYSYGRYQREAKRLYTLLNDRLAESPYLAGPDYSIADIATYPWTQYVEQHRLSVEDYPHMERWRRDLGERDGVKRGNATIDTLAEQDKALFAKTSQEDLDRFFGKTRD